MFSNISRGRLTNATINAISLSLCCFVNVVWTWKPSFDTLFNMILMFRLLLIKPKYDLLYRKHARSDMNKYVAKMYASKKLIQFNASAETQSTIDDMLRNNFVSSEFILCQFHSFMSSRNPLLDLYWRKWFVIRIVREHVIQYARRNSTTIWFANADEISCSIFQLTPNGRSEAWKKWL